DGFHTGAGGYPEAGSIAISDRKKDVIISGGENVSSIEVEDCLFQHAAVAEAAVIGVPDEKWGETIKALVVLRPGATATERDLMEHCRSRMAHYKCPTSVEIRDALVRTATGKLQKFKLREPYWVGRARRVNTRGDLPGQRQSPPGWYAAARSSRGDPGSAPLRPLRRLSRPTQGRGAMLGDVVELSVVVRDIEAAIERYTRLFGLEVHHRG